MKTGFKIIFLLFLMMQSSCEDINIYDCKDCNEEEPYDCELSVKLNNVYNAVDSFHVTIYQGKVEDDIVIYDQRVGDSFSLWVPLNSEYSVKALYSKGENQYISINSTFPRVKYREDYCDVPCYFIKDNEVDMRIKYY